MQRGEVLKLGASKYISRSGDFQISHTLDNESLIHACLGKRLNPAIFWTRPLKNSYTQKVKSFNRTFWRSLPRDVTFTRNFSGRVHGAAHSSNNGPGNSMHGLCSGVSASIPTGGSVDELQTAHKMDKMYQRPISYKTQRVNKHRKLFELHAKHQEKLKYKKNMMLVEACTRGQKKHSEHNSIISVTKRSH